MKHIGLFEGIGGFSLAARWMGWQTIAWCEWNEFGQKVLRHHFPEAEGFGDITKTDFTKYADTIDILTGGFPCQPYSLAGKRKGKDDERHLWPEMLRAIREIRPSWVMGENVFGLINWNGGMVFNEVQTDLEAEGYEVWPYVLPACAVNAPHRRDRVWFVARRVTPNSSCTRQPCWKRCNGEGKQKRIYKRTDRPCEIGVTTNSNISPTKHSIQAGGNLSTSTFQQTPTHSHSDGQQRGNCNNEINTSEGGKYALNDTKQIDVADCTGNGSRRQLQQQQKQGEFGRCDCGEIIADTCNKGLEGSQVHRSLAGIGQNRNKQPSGCVPPNWQNFPTQSPICFGNDGIPNRLDGITFPKWRNESIKSAGNAIVPQVAFQIFKAIEQYANTTKFL